MVVLRLAVRQAAAHPVDGPECPTDGDARLAVAPCRAGACPEAEVPTESGKVELPMEAEERPMEVVHADRVALEDDLGDLVAADGREARPIPRAHASDSLEEGQSPAGAAAKVQVFCPKEQQAVHVLEAATSLEDLDGLCNLCRASLVCLSLAALSPEDDFSRFPVPHSFRYGSPRASFGELRVAEHRQRAQWQ